MERDGAGGILGGLLSNSEETLLDGSSFWSSFGRFFLEGSFCRSFLLYLNFLLLSFLRLVELFGPSVISLDDLFQFFVVDALETAANVKFFVFRDVPTKPWIARS